MSESLITRELDDGRIAAVYGTSISHLRVEIDGEEAGSGSLSTGGLPAGFEEFAGVVAGKLPVTDEEISTIREAVQPGAKESAREEIARQEGIARRIKEEDERERKFADDTGASW